MGLKLFVGYKPKIFQVFTIANMYICMCNQCQCSIHSILFDTWKKVKIGSNYPIYTVNRDILHRIYTVNSDILHSIYTVNSDILHSE